MQFTVLFAETDGDSTAFYRHCRFKTDEFCKNFGSSDVKRCKCVLIDYKHKKKLKCEKTQIRKNGMRLISYRFFIMEDI